MTMLRPLLRRGLHLSLKGMSLLLSAAILVSLVSSCHHQSNQQQSLQPYGPKLPSLQPYVPHYEASTQPRQRGTDVVVAVIDSGIDLSHPVFEGHVWTNADEIPGNGIDDDHNGYIDDVHGWDFRDMDNNSLVGTPMHSHGTGVASIIVAGNVQTPSDTIRVMDVRFLDSGNSFHRSDWPRFVDAVEYAVANGADIINLSMFSNGKPPGIAEKALMKAAMSGVIVVGIAGNMEYGQVMYPAIYKSVIAVSATADDFTLVKSSNYGSDVDFAALGEDVEVARPINSWSETYELEVQSSSEPPMLSSAHDGGMTRRVSGTSFAAPQVSRAAAMIIACHPEFSPSDVIRFLREHAIDAGPQGNDIYTGYGVIDPVAIESALLGGGVGANVSP